MKFRLFSDIHLEFDHYTVRPHDDDKDTILVLAGDIIPLYLAGQLKRFFDETAHRFKYVVYVCGNHEYYNSNLSFGQQIFKNLAETYKNVHCLNDEAFIIDDVAIIGSTLWTDFNKGNPMSMLNAEMAMNDFRIIKMSDKDYRKFKPKDAYNIHIESKKFIFDEIKKHKDAGLKTLVVTHHGPSRMSIHEMFAMSNINSAYVSDLSNEILDTEPNIWCHGHTHTSFDYMIGNVTRVICNPRGYYNENSAGFDHQCNFVL